MFRSILALGAFVAMPAMAGTDFGTKDEARSLAEQLISIIDQEGIKAAAAAVVAPDSAFRNSRMGVNLFRGSVVIADNREPETVAADYSTVADLTGDPVWPRIGFAADVEDDAVLLWYHYDTQETYEYHCFSLRAQRDNGLVMVCR